MKTTEYVETLWEVAHSRLFYDYVATLHSEETDTFTIEVFEKVIIIMYNKTGYYAIAPIVNENNTVDWVHVTGENYAFILTQHTMTRYIKRHLNKAFPDKHFDIRGKNYNEKIMMAINVIGNINEHCYFCEGLSINPKYADNVFVWTKDGLITAVKFSEHSIKSTTFIAFEMLNREQLDIFYRIEDVLVQIGKLKKEGNKIIYPDGAYAIRGMG